MLARFWRRTKAACPDQPGGPPPLCLHQLCVCWGTLLFSRPSIRQPFGFHQALRASAQQRRKQGETDVMTKDTPPRSHPPSAAVDALTKQSDLIGMMRPEACSLAHVH